jgi:hypothetical protein
MVQPGISGFGNAVVLQAEQNIGRKPIISDASRPTAYLRVNEHSAEHRPR